jgi:hypothetical protein
MSEFYPPLNSLTTKRRVELVGCTHLTQPTHEQVIFLIILYTTYAFNICYCHLHCYRLQPMTV